MENPIRTCDCKIREDAMPNPKGEVITIATVCSHGIAEPEPTESFFGRRVQLIHLMSTVLHLWADDDSTEEGGAHVYGYVINMGMPDEVHLWKLEGDEEPSIGWDICHQNQNEDFGPHQRLPVFDWAINHLDWWEKRNLID